MGKHEGAKKNVKRLQLRREVIRVLAGDSLARVGGGVMMEDGTVESTCWPSVIRTLTTGTGGTTTR